jgi:signal transduction histidine kinase
MQIKKTLGASFPGSVESPPLEDVVVLVDSAGIALGVQRAFSVRVRSVRDGQWRHRIQVRGDSARQARRRDLRGPVRTAPRSDTRGVLSSRGPQGVWAIGDVAQFVVHDINNLLAVIDSDLRLLECQSDAAYRKAIVGKMQEAITRGALLTRQLLDAARPCPKSSGEFVAGSRLAAMAGALDQALRPDITVRTKIAPDLWAFNSDPEEPYFALLNPCRNSADAAPSPSRRGGFTMSLFIAGQAFPSATDFSAAKIAVFAASILSAVVGTALLWELRARSLSKRRRRAPACNYRSPPAFMRDREQEIFR